MAAVVKDERIARLGALAEPAECVEYVRSGGDGFGVLLIVSQHEGLINVIVVGEEFLDVYDVVDAPSQLALLTEVIDPDEQRAAVSSHLAQCLGGLLGRLGRIRCQNVPAATL